MQIRGPLMWFVGPWAPPFIAASHTHTQNKSTTLQTHILHIAHTFTYTQYAIHTLLFLLTHFLPGIKNAVLCADI